MFSGEAVHAGVEHLRVAVDQFRTTRDLGIEPLRLAVVDRQHVVADRLDQQQPLQLVQLLGHLLRQVVGLRPVVGAVQLPHVVVERGKLPGHDPRGAVFRAGSPALVIDAAVADHLEVLRLAELGRARVVEGRDQALALQRHLLHAVHERRLGDPGRVEHRRRHVDHMAELGADLAPGLEAVRPVHDRAVAGAAPMRGDLLHPLVGRVHRVRPADREVVEGLRRAELVDARRHELGRLDRGRPVERDHPVERAVRPTLARAAVVAGDVDDQRVVEDLHVLQRVDHTADLVVGVLHVAGVDLHLPRQHRLQLVRHVRPRPGFPSVAR